MVTLEALTAYTDELLQVGAYKDYAPNGLQVAGRSEVRRLVTGVTACEALLEAAVAEEADAVLVHHGYFWKSEAPEVVGMKYRRLKRLLDHDIALLAYHLPLDAHPELGNNAELARLLGFVVEGTLNDEGIGNHGRLPEPLAPAA
ncbi:MAG TPA: Nif3-like dinuclear metal center hexameric protein, partial [Gammaproteobacteria bacterium]|nr:Nif3-like dinuclear metal center hexameric protein [Gammaproteobacteria bacterium]